jgi:hypothetical protein
MSTSSVSFCHHRDKLVKPLLRRLFEGVAGYCSRRISGARWRTTEAARRR